MNKNYTKLKTINNLKKYPFKLQRCCSIYHREYNVISDEGKYLGYVEQRLPNGIYNFVSVGLTLNIKSYDLAYIKKNIHVFG